MDRQEAKHRDEEYLFSKNVPKPYKYATYFSVCGEEFRLQFPKIQSEYIYYINRNQCMIMALCAGNLPTIIVNRLEEKKLQDLRDIHCKSYNTLIKVQAYFPAVFVRPNYTVRREILNFITSYQKMLRKRFAKFKMIDACDLNKISQKEACQYILYLQEIVDELNAEIKKPISEPPSKRPRNFL